ncbi:MAG: acetyl-CoA acetyltransferase [Bdellovibrionales bacterium RIFCSPHIGHO2_01_FULL_40_29]|nr:MAG: acetyl-CoA acetyltransferase [Bdellovibrionales bacterium RIFCSPHIGHO2_01_FULL_40_29]OFZ33202.1 MAG: acetyl-CoA acetyltransferase [Bdellovibrionales bacterium RIFCSPHIGHO2_02_FULL_40_15]
MKSEANPVFVLGSARIPFAKSQTTYAEINRKDLMTASLNALVSHYNLKGQFIGDIALGAIMNSSADFNLARECALETSLDPNSPAYNVQRACGNGLEVSWQIALKAHTGAIDLGIAGGVDTNSDLPIEVSARFQRALLNLNKAKTIGERIKILSGISLKDLKPKIPGVNEPRTKLSMGDHTELMVKEWKISREAQDEVAFASHVNGFKAYEEGFFNDLVFPFGGIKRDGTLRGDTTIEKLSKLKPAFDKTNGTLTAGNSSPLTDGSACVLIGNLKGAEKVNAKPLAKFVDVQVAAVDFAHGAGLLMAPTKAVAQLLTRNNLTFQDFDFFEIHEAFAGQVLCNLKAWETESYCRDVLKLSSALGTIDRKKMNVVGSSLAMGHPFAATGARITGTLAKLLSQSGKKRGLISICTAGGMGIAAILESV